MVKVRVWSGNEPAGATGMKENFISNPVCLFRSNRRGLQSQALTEMVH